MLVTANLDDFHQRTQLREAVFIMPTNQTFSQIPSGRQVQGMEILDTMDILHELRNNQFLLECLDRVIEDACFDADSEQRKRLTQIFTVLAAYDNEKVTKKLETAIALLEELTG